MNEMVKLLQLYEDIKGDIYGKLYKGTRQPLGDFDKYAYGGFGTFFSTSKWKAEFFAKYRWGTGYIYEAKIKSNLKLFDTNNKEAVDKLLQWYVTAFPNERVDIDNIVDSSKNWDFMEQNEILEKLQKDGYDGLVLNESSEHIVFLYLPIEDKLEYIKLISDNKRIE